MELILKSDSRDKMAKILALANTLGISVVQKKEVKTSPVPPRGKEVSAKELLEMFGQEPDFSTSEEIRTKVWPSAW